MLFNRKASVLLAFLLCSVLMLAACNSDNKAEDQKDTNKTEEKTVTDAIGKVTIPANPKKVLAPNLEDYLVTLGITPTAQWSIGTTVHTYLQDQLKDVPRISWDMPIEDVIEANPDLIIFESQAAIPEGQYEEYKKVAPVYVFKDEDRKDWRTQLTVMGELFDKKDEAKAAIADYKEKAENAKNDVQEKIGNESAAIIWVTGGQYFVFEGDRYASNVLYNDLGIQKPKYIENLGGAKATWQGTSLEALADLDADHIFIAALPDEAGLKTLENSSVWKSLPAVKKGNVYTFDDQSNWTTNAKTANDKTIDLVLKTFKNK